MRVGLHLFGWALLGLTALSLVGEMAARGLYDTRGFYLSVEELWAALAPDSFAEFRSWFRSQARPLWTYGLGPIFKLPAWFLFGLPGLLAGARVAEKAFAEGRGPDPATLCTSGCASGPAEETVDPLQ